MRSIIRAGALSASLALAAWAPALAQNVGKAGAVNPASTGTPPGGSTRTLELGSNVVFRERIRTTAGGNMQLIFVDKTTMSIGPNSDLVIDEFVYDPNAGAGRMAVSMAKGVMRFVGGNISHSSGASIKTPSATLGIRGGVLGVEVDARTRETEAILYFGRLTVTRSDPSGAPRVETYSIPGSKVTIPAGSSTTTFAKASAADVNRQASQTTSQGGQTGGSGGVSAAAVERANTAGPQILAAIPPSAASLQGNTAQTSTSATTLNVSATETTRELRSSVVTSTNQQAAQQVAQEIEAQHPTSSPSSPSPPRRTLTPEQRQAKAFALVTTPDPALNSPIPYVIGTAVASGPVGVSPIVAYRNEQTDPDATKPARARTLQVAGGINGQGSAQTSNIMVSTGIYDVNDQGDPYYNAGFTHTTRRASNFTMGRANGAITSLPNSVSVNSDGTPSSFTVNQDDTTGAAGNDRIPRDAFARAGNNAPLQQYKFQQPVSSTAVPGALVARPAAELGGWSGGLVRTLNVTTNTNIESAQPVIGVAHLQLDPNDSRAQLSLVNVVSRPGATPAGGLESAYVQIGNVDPNERARSTYIDYDNFGGREAVTNVTATSRTPLSRVNFASSGVDPSTGGTPLTNDHSLMISANSTDVEGAFPGVTFCRCEFTRWGFWSQETQRTDAGVEYSDRTHLGTWVVGQTTPDVEVPTTGIATYTGHAIASIRAGLGANSVEYVAAGNFSNRVDFGQRTGLVNVTNLDNRNYAGTVQIPAGVNFVGGTIAQTGVTQPALMSLVGQFFRGPTSPVGEMGGNLTITGPGATPNYVGSGIFAASIR